ncbi:inorganic phosphate transporter [Bryobacter aggregatus]|uniref:inorganic phosphate transporter n=1 Tax=Bryobacter aggregatus TaxID=360054 RepID=UPI00192E4E84|nr:inorganic phosphate transporter [Bryobacter aggregatus]
MLFLLAVLLALGFEVVNGFHDTANAVATVIYTNSLRPTIAVVWSGLWNLIGVLVSNGAVAFGIITLLPVELVLNVGSSAGMAMVFSLLVAAILWNLGTWYLGLPASSSHTLIGSILGVGLAHSVMSAEVFGEGVNWGKAQEVFASLLLSPLIGFGCAGLLLLLCKLLIKSPKLYEAPAKDHPPPLWIRAILIFTCTGVSFAHGSNDGQKGMGLMMLILIGALPASYALNEATTEREIARLLQNAKAVSSYIEQHYDKSELSPSEAALELSNYLKPNVSPNRRTPAAIAILNRELEANLEGRRSMLDIPSSERPKLRTDIYLVDESLSKFLKQGRRTEESFRSLVRNYREDLDGSTHFIPVWVKVAVALALGMGTMVGWKRIVVTVGEKIGKDHLTYAQGASAELVAMITIGVADQLGLPVSTTHVLTSGVAGTMAANRSGVQMNTVRNMLLAWIFTLPACVFLGAALFGAGLYAISRLGI